MPLYVSVPLPGPFRWSRRLTSRVYVIRRPSRFRNPLYWLLGIWIFEAAGSAAGLACDRGHRQGSAGRERLARCSAERPAGHELAGRSSVSAQREHDD